MQYILYKNCIHFHLKSHYKSFHFHQYFHYILQLIYHLICFYICSFYNLNILQHHMNLSHSQSQLLGFQINPLLHIPLSINSLHSHQHLSLFHLSLLLQALASDLYLHLQVLCYPIYLVSLVLDIILNTLTFKPLTTSGTHNFTNGSLILLQLPLHVLTKYWKDKTKVHYC